MILWPCPLAYQAETGTGVPTSHQSVPSHTPHPHHYLLTSGGGGGISTNREEHPSSWETPESGHQSNKSPHRPGHPGAHHWRPLSPSFSSPLAIADLISDRIWLSGSLGTLPLSALYASWQGGQASTQGTARIESMALGSSCSSGSVNVGGARVRAIAAAFSFRMSMMKDVYHLNHRRRPGLTTQAIRVDSAML